MKMIELKEALKELPVSELVKNIVGTDTSDNPSLITADRLAAVLGGLRYDMIPFSVEDNSMIKLGHIDKAKKTKDFFQLILDHTTSSLDNLAYVSIGSRGNPSEPFEKNIRCCILNLKGSLDLYYDKDTFDYFFKPVNKWDTTYVQRIECYSSFSYEKVLYNADKHIKITPE